MIEKVKLGSPQYKQTEKLNAVIEYVNNASSKEVITVNISTMINDTDIETFLSLTERYVNGEIVIIGYVGTVSGVITAVENYSDTNKAWTVAVPITTATPEAGTGGQYGTIDTAQMAIYVVKYNGTNLMLAGGNFPLGGVSGDYLPLSGGTLTGALEAPSYSENGTKLEDKYALKSEISGSGSCDCETTPVVSGTQTSATASWTGVASKLTELKDGQSIRYWLPYSGSGNATLNLTLADGTTTGAINCYYKGNTRLSTQFSAGSMIELTYRENITIESGTTTYTGWWTDGADNVSTYSVYQYSTTKDGVYPILFRYTAGNTSTSTYNGMTRYNNNFWFNPYSGMFHAPKLAENDELLEEKYALKSEIPSGGGVNTEATTTTAGLMSASDKAKLDGITASADSVSFTRSLTSGTQIGTITINGTGTAIYAPTAPTVPETKLYRHTVKLFHESDYYNSNAVAIVITKSSDRFENLTEFNSFLYDNGYLQNSDADEAIVTGDGCPAKGISVINSSGECYLVMSVAYKSAHGGSYINAVKYEIGKNTIKTLGLWLTDIEDTVHEIL